MDDLLREKDMLYYIVLLGWGRSESFYKSVSGLVSQTSDVVVAFRKTSVWMAVAVRITDVLKWKPMWCPTPAGLPGSSW